MRSSLVVLFAVLSACARMPSETSAPARAEPARTIPHAPAGRFDRDNCGPTPISAVPVPTPSSPPPTSSAPLRIHAGPRAVRAEAGAVTSAEPRATRAGVRILEQGGNAVDAAVAVAYALAVTNPSAGNLGGGGFMLLRPVGGPTLAIDFRETAPRALSRAAFDTMIGAGGLGAAAVGVPGSVAGLELAHDRFGRLPRADVMKPAIELAHGHTLGARQADLLRQSFAVLSRDPAAATIFARGKRAIGAGELLVQKDLERTLQRIRDNGRAGFYAGETARALAALSGGLLTKDDLAGYAAKVREPLAFGYRGLDVEVMPAPSAGGVAVAETLLMLEKLGARNFAPHSADELHVFLEASRRAQAERRFGVVDPDSLDAETLSRRSRHFLDPNAWLGPTPIDLGRATASSAVHSTLDAAAHESEHTTHFAVVDRAGMVVSCTMTLSGSFGAKLVAPGTGVVLNNSVASFSGSGANTPAGGRRTTSSMAPTLVLQAGVPVLVLGSPGGDTIPSAIVQVLRHVVDHGESLEEAVDAARFHQSFLPDEARFEPGRPPPRPVAEELKRRGHTLKQSPYRMGDVNAILLQDGVAWAYADPREPGLALAASSTSRTR